MIFSNRASAPAARLYGRVVGHHRHPAPIDHAQPGDHTVRGSSSASTLAKRPSSMKEPLSSSRSRRSRTVSLFCSRSLGR